MTLYELFHSVSPEVLLKNISRINTQNDVVYHLESTYLPLVLSALPEKDDGVPIYVLRDRQFKPIVAFDTSLDAEITLGKILGRQIMVSEPFKHSSAGMIAAQCYCALPVGIVVDPSCKCNAIIAFDKDHKSIVTKVDDYILMY